MPYKDGKHPGGRPPTSKHPDVVAAAREQLEAEARSRMLDHARIILTRELIDEIVSRLGSGNYPSVIAESLGVTASTFLNWLQKGRTAWETRDAPETEFTTAADPEALRVELYLRVTRGEAEWESGLVDEMAAKIRGGSYWQGHMTMLQRRKPDRWDARGRQEGGDATTLEERLAELERDRAREPAAPTAG